MHRTSAIFLATLFLTAADLFAGYPTRDAWIPVVGHAVGYAGRGFYTTVYLTDLSQETNDVTLSFYAAAQPHVVPRQITLQLGPQQTATVDLGPPLVGEAGATGALRIHSTGRLVATARDFSRGANETPASEVGATLNAIPSQDSIGTGESTLLHVPAGARYKIYAVETHGFPLDFAVTTMPGSAERRLYLSPYEQRSWDLEELFHGTSATSLQVTCISGSGKIIVAGTSIAQTSQDFVVWEMLLPTEPRHRMRWPELAAYFAVALALASSAIYKMWAVGSRLSAGGPVSVTTDSGQPTADNP